MVHVFSWCKTKTIEIETRKFITDQKKLNLVKLGDWLYTESQTKWLKTPEEDFEFIEISPPDWAINTTWILSIVLCIGIYVWIVMNNFTSTDINGDGYNEIDENKNYSIRPFINRIRRIFTKEDTNPFK